MDGGMEGRTHEWMDGRTERERKGNTDGWMDGWIEGSMRGPMLKPLELLSVRNDD